MSFTTLEHFISSFPVPAHPKIHSVSDLQNVKAPHFVQIRSVSKFKGGETINCGALSHIYWSQLYSYSFIFTYNELLMVLLKLHSTCKRVYLCFPMQIFSVIALFYLNNALQYIVNAKTVKYTFPITYTLMKPQILWPEQTKSSHFIDPTL